MEFHSEENNPINPKEDSLKRVSGSFVAWIRQRISFNSQEGDYRVKNKKENLNH